MSYADKVFCEMCKDIIENGTDTQGEKVRPKWEDGSPAYTIKRFGVVNRYDLRKEFPALTLRPTALKSCMDEILWIYQKKSNNVNDLNSHIWDSWAKPDGSIGKAYGYQIGKRYVHHKVSNMSDTPSVSEYKSLSVKGTPGKFDIMFDQMDAVLYDLKNTPFNRRIITNTYNHSELSEMGLQPCAYSCTFNVTDEGNDKLVLNLLMNQRSQDILVANNWNVAQYAILLMMVAQSVDMIPGELVHVIADAHIYDRHVDIVKELIQREQFPAPRVTLNPDVKDFYDFTTKDLIVENYITNPQIKDIPVAV